MTCWIVEGVVALMFKQGIDSTLFYAQTSGTMPTHEPPHNGHLIKKELALQGRSVAWLAKMTGCSRQNMYHLLERGFIYTDHLLKICQLLNCDFFECYSDYLRTNKDT